MDMKYWYLRILFWLFIIIFTCWKEKWDYNLKNIIKSSLLGCAILIAIFVQGGE